MTATLIRKVHHVAYRCKDAKQTVEWYGKYLQHGLHPRHRRRRRAFHR
jgi:catechol 2,3-dioxygenase-like lactoylglutathione lyase family enzyme